VNLLLFEEQLSRYELPRSDAVARHVTSILRSAIGDSLRIGVVNGPRGTGVLTRLDDRSLVIEATWPDRDQPTLQPLPIRLILGHPRPPVLRRLWRDLTSIRVARIDVFVGDLAEQSYLASSIWQSVDAAVREGLSQGMHTVPPVITRWRSLDALLSGTKDAVPIPESGAAGAIRLFGHVGGEDTRRVSSLSTLASALQETADPSVTIAVGPERGFTERELTVLERAGFRGIGMGPSVLRTETATIALTASAAALLWEVSRCGRDDPALYLH
jgi:16S rRNA (uracil1498-N3)-methyltransferase